MVEAGPVEVKEKCRNENQGNPAVVTPVAGSRQALKAQNKSANEGTGKEYQVNADNRAADNS